MQHAIEIPCYYEDLSRNWHIILNFFQCKWNKYLHICNWLPFAHTVRYKILGLQLFLIATVDISLLFVCHLLLHRRSLILAWFFCFNCNLLSLTLPFLPPAPPLFFRWEIFLLILCWFHLFCFILEKPLFMYSSDYSIIMILFFHL